MTEPWENVTPGLGIRYPKPTVPVRKLAEAFAHMALDVERVLEANGVSYHAGTDAERRDAPPRLNHIWIVTDKPNDPKYIGTGTKWVRL